jgi:hypothetical protein
MQVASENLKKKQDLVTKCAALFQQENENAKNLEFLEFQMEL